MTADTVDIAWTQLTALTRLLEEFQCSRWLRRSIRSIALLVCYFYCHQSRISILEEDKVAQTRCRVVSTSVLAADEVGVQSQDLGLEVPELSWVLAKLPWPS